MSLAKKIYRWRKKAMSKLADPNRRSSDEYLKLLNNQAKGRCVTCGIGEIESFIQKNNQTEIQFSCGHGHKEVFIQESLRMRDSIKLLLVPEGKGKRRYVLEHIQGWFSSKDENLKEGVFKERRIDKKNDIYKEKVVDAADKNHVIKDQEQPLSEHRGHGSAKFKK